MNVPDGCVWGKLGPTLSKQRRSICQRVPSLERRDNWGSYFMRRISECSLDGDEGLHQLQSRSCYKTTWLPYERGATGGTLESPQGMGNNAKKDKDNGPIGGYRKWLKSHTQKGRKLRHRRKMKRCSPLGQDSSKPKRSNKGSNQQLLRSKRKMPN